MYRSLCIYMYFIIVRPIITSDHLCGPKNLISDWPKVDLNFFESIHTHRHDSITPLGPFIPQSNTTNTIGN